VTNCDVGSRSKCLILHNIFYENRAKRLVLERLLGAGEFVLLAHLPVMQAQGQQGIVSRVNPVLQTATLSLWGLPS